MEDKPLTESINKQYSKYGSLRVKQEPKIELCNEAADDPLKFLSRIDSSIKDAKAEVKKLIDNSSIPEDYDTSSYNCFDEQDCNHIARVGSNDIPLDTIPMVKLDKSSSSLRDVKDN